MSIELIIQTRSGRFPVQAEPQTTLAEVVSSIDDSKNATTLRYLQTSVHNSQWESMTLSNLGLQKGARAKLILEGTSVAGAMDTSAGDTIMTDASNDSTAALQTALESILKQNFDEDSKICLTTILKILDNCIQKPNNPKVRSIRLANPNVAEKIVQKGGVDYLLACGFVRQTSAPELLSKSTQGEECLVLLEQNESTSTLVKARRLAMQTLIQELHVKADDLPKYKPPPAAVSVASTSTSTTSNTTFNPYQRHRFNATGQPQQPDSYESTTETKLRQLQSRQQKLESQLQGQALEDRELVALRPNQQAPVTSTTTTTTTNGPSDGTLLAQRMQRLEKERKEREEGGFTTKAMRDLQSMQKSKVYSHAKLRIQFSDGSAIEAKFLPKETIATVKQVVMDCFCIEGLDFDLYVAPPRRMLDVQQTLQQEGLVPAAKCFCSWKGGGAPANGAEFLKPELYASDTSAVPAFPTAKPVVAAAKKKEAPDGTKPSGGAAKKPSREDDLLRRMMGGANGSKAKKAGDGKSGGEKPKWFKG